MSGAEIPPERLDELFAIIEQKSGIFVEAARREYLGADLLARQARSGHRFDDYLSLLASAAGQKELDHLVDLATNNETYFFREPNHFRALTAHILPALLAARRSAITIWSAGCSTGEEPYSIAMAVLRMAEHDRDLRAMQVRILGTDVSQRAIEKARQGHYTKNSFRAMSEADLARFFVERPRSYEVKEAVRELCDFRVMNLLEDTGDSYFDGLDVIFCRNVTIYFREATIQRLNRRLANSLREGGYLIFGATETLQHQSEDLHLCEVEGSFLYRKGSRAPEPPPAPRREPSGRHKKPSAPSASGRRSGAFPRAAVAAAADAARKEESVYARALALVKDERHVEALPLLEEAARSDDRGERRIHALAALASIT
ncbi:MAG: protein-glutamate O-methyltransferase CheR [Acidobacteriota bacterium]